MSLALGLALLLVGPTLAEIPPEVAAAPAAVAVERLATDEALRGLQLGASVRCTRDKAIWGGHGATARLNPASGAKLLTTAAALHELPPDHTFATRVLGRRDGAVARDVVIVSEADPSLSDDDFGRLADALKGAGVTRIEGGITMDISYFAGTSTPPAYDTKRSDAGYRPEVPAFAIDSGAFFATVSPGKRVGDPVRVTTSLVAPSLVVDNRATTVAGKAIDKLVIEARDGPRGRTRLVVSGSLGKDAKPQGVKKRMIDPARIGAEVLIKTLEKRGIAVDGALEIRAEAPPTPAAAAQDAGIVELARIDSDPLAADIAATNITSNNFMAETIFKHLGVAGSPAKPSGPATWERAVERTTSALRDLGLDPDGFEIVNGSGLYDGTKVSADTMTELLAIESADTPAARTFRESLAVAGKSGTLRGRLKKLTGKVSGKTGTLDDALSLSGYVPSRRCLLAFSVLVNGDIGKRAAAVVRRIDGFVLDLASL